VVISTHHMRSYLPTMSDTRAPSGWPDEAGIYEIRLAGLLEARWAVWFDGMTLTQASDGTTIIRGQITDQAALHGLLQRVRDLGLPLLSLTQTQQPTQKN